MNKENHLYDDKEIYRKINKSKEYYLEYLNSNCSINNEYIPKYTCEIDKNILYLFYDDPIKYDRLITELNIDVNNHYNLIGIMT